VVDALLWAMKRHAGIPCLQQYAWTCLANVVVGDPNESTKLMNKGCIEVVLAVMEAHLQDKPTQEDACKFFISLVESNKKNAANGIWEKGGIAVVTNTVDHFKGKDENMFALAKKLMEMIVQHY
jgi:Tfp pilus assembly ATPase PilU